LTILLRAFLGRICSALAVLRWPIWLPSITALAIAALLLTILRLIDLAWAVLHRVRLCLAIPILAIRPLSIPILAILTLPIPVRPVLILAIPIRVSLRLTIPGRLLGPAVLFVWTRDGWSARRRWAITTRVSLGGVALLGPRVAINVLRLVSAIVGICRFGPIRSRWSAPRLPLTRVLGGLFVPAGACLGGALPRWCRLPLRRPIGRTLIGRRTIRI
jgi:hypothetical protein